MSTTEERLEIEAGYEDVGQTEIAVRSLEKKTLSALRRYLSSNIFHDVGPVTARRIVSFLGIRTAQMIESALHEVLNVKGVGVKRMFAIKRGWSYQKRLIDKSAKLMNLKSVE
jgi:ATP-dependent exoDNAse (exonuclease V) alpha subunit